jgi:hypothetical protein
VARRKAKGYAAHVRIHRFEMDTEAWRTMSCYGRSLLIEMRSLYTGRENRVFMSLRQIMRRLGVGRKAAERARDELMERGWIRMLEQGSFNQKTRHAPVYALEHEPLEDRDGAVAPKSFMGWSRENTVYLGSTDGVPREHRDKSKAPKNGVHGVPGEHRNRKNAPPTVYLGSTQLVNHRGTDK